MRTFLFTTLLFFVATLFANAVAAENIAQGVKVIVIDAGHGGPRFPGASYRGVYEKTLNLKVALKLGRLIEENMPEIKVVYTRKTDCQLGNTLSEDLQARADIANKAEGDLFIAIHANAARSTKAQGVETLVMGESPREQAANENVLFANNKEEFMDMSNQKTAAIVRAYIQNLQFTYGEYSEAMARFVQRNYVNGGRVDRGVKRQPLKVLYATDMPGILTEIGFMSNAQEFARLTSEKGQDEIACSLFEAVKDYVAYVRGTLLVDEGTRAQSKPTVQPVVEPVAESLGEPVAEQPVPSVEPSAPQVQAKPATAKPQPVTPKNEQTPPTVKQETVVSAVATEGYTVQIVASVKVVPLTSSQFKQYKNSVKQYTSSGTFRYKYCVGEFRDKPAAQAKAAEVRKSFPEAFVVHYAGDKIVK
ncbi:MAG: N-acetylmuramoyl-L-alanine amidase [Alistipes sp.]